jgi:drug/metabolite transporter (DMT)-like permease
MGKKNLKKGLFFASIGTFLGGFNPIIANSRPLIIDAYLFAALTVIVEAIIFFPLMMVERKKIKSDFKKKMISFEVMDSFLYGYKKNIPILIFIGLVFGGCMILFFLGYRLAGAINGALVVKTTVFFSLFFGWLILSEKISIRQIIFSIILFFGLFLAVTQGSFDLLELNIGVLVLLIVSAVWMFTHALAKPLLDRDEITSIQMVCIRNVVSAIFLFSTYFIFYPLENVNLLMNPETLFWGILMGASYGTGLFLWYKVLENIEINKATVILSSNLIVTAFFAMIILGEVFTIFHLIGTIIVIISIIVIVNQKKEEDKEIDII